MRTPLRYQLLAPILLLLLGVAAVSVWLAVVSIDQARHRIEKRVRDVAQLVNTRQFPLTGNVLEQMKHLTEADFVLVPEEGRPLTTLDTVPPDLPAPESLADDWHELRLGPRLTVAGRVFLGAGIRLRPPREPGTLYVLYPEALWRDALWEAVGPSLILLGFVGLGSLGLAVGLGQHAARRVGELERRTRRIAGGDFSPVPLPQRDDELRDLARSVNEMAQRLAQLQEAARRTERLRLLGQVGGGLAHQLRNGLTGAKLALQLYAREQAGQTDTAALDVALRQLTLLETHLKRFLDLGKEGTRRERVDLNVLLREAVELVRPQCRHAGITLNWEPTGDERAVTGDRGQLGQLVLNVLGNAVEAAGPGGVVEVRMESNSGSGHVIEVWDSGPGPGAEVADRLFEPFVTGKPEGVGLGLAVARQVAEAHGGRIAWRREDDQTCFRIELPAGGPEA